MGVIVRFNARIYSLKINQLENNSKKNDKILDCIVTNMYLCRRIN